MRLFRFIVAIVLVCGLQNLSAQVFEKGFRFNDTKSRSVKVSFELINNLIIIPLQINNSENLHFIFDTGIRTTIITELPSSDSLTFSYNKVQILQGLGEGRNLEAYPSYGNTIRMEGITGFNQDIYVLGANDLNFSGRLGTRVNGIIGYDLIKDFVVEVNYQEHHLIFHPKGSGPTVRGGSWFSLPLEIMDQKPYLTANIQFPNSYQLHARLLMDLGGGFALWLSPESDSGISIPEPRTRTYLGYGLNGEIGGYMAPVSGITLGPVRFEQPYVAFPDSNAVGKVVKDELRHGSIGAEILRRFNIVIDYEGQKVWFRPNSNYSDEFSFNRSGLELIAPLPGAKVYIVSRVEEGSRAAQAGIQEGDQLITINLRLASECTMNDLNTFLHGRFGKKLRLTLMRQGETYKATVLLED
jgi:hypothetical protein